MRSVNLARHMGFSKPSICHAVKVLKQGGFLTMDGDGNMANILMIEAEENILQEVITFLSERTHCQITHLPSCPDTLSFSGLEIRSREQMVYRDGGIVSMSHHEFFTLLYLAQHPGWVFSKEQIYEEVWKESGTNCRAAVTNVVSQIRRKIGEGYIRTVFGSGYRLEE